MKAALRALGLLPALRWLRHDLAPSLQFWRFRSRYAHMLRLRTPPSARPKSALLVSGPHTGLLVDLWVIKALALAGFSTAVLSLNARRWDRYFRLAGARDIHRWEDFAEPNNLLEQAKAVVGRSNSLSDIAKFEYAGVRVGRIAASTTLRELRVGSLELESSSVQRDHLAGLVARSMALAVASRELLRRAAPDCAVFYDMIYLRRGELFDRCLIEGIPTAVWHPSHRNNALILKRYDLASRENHPVSLSPDSWRTLMEITWTDAHRLRLQGELSRAYSQGDWYGESGTQFAKRRLGAGEIRKELRLDPARKTAFIFPHIAWDAPLSWGESLFDTYEQWLVETVRAACRNDRLNWVIKIHPANIGKQLKEGYSGEPAELLALRRHVGTLPGHVKLLPAGSAISTFALFELMDYCLTVRGTIGIEAASFGIPVITGGTGRYDRKGFTVDSASRAQYLERLGRLQDIAPPSPAARELAERFAYGVFILRPFPLQSISLEFDEEYSPEDNFTMARINAASTDEWDNARDLNLLANWLANADNADFMSPIAEDRGAGD